MNVRRLIIAFFALSLPIAAWGSEFRVTPSIGVSEQYNNNIVFTASDMIKDQITDYSPGLEMTDRTERFDSNIQVRLDLLHYEHNRNLDATSQTWSGKVRYLATPRLGLTTEAGYIRNPNPTLTVNANGIVTAPTPWNHITSTLGADYQFSEITTGIVSYNYGRDYYDDPRYQDDVSHDLNVGLVRDFSRDFSSTKGRVNVGYSYYYLPDVIIKSVMSTVGFSKNLSELWSVSLDAGLRHTWSDVAVIEPVPSASIVIDGQPVPLAYTDARVDISRDGWGSVGTASLNYQGEILNMSLALNRDITPAYGLNGVAERNSVTLYAYYHPAYETSFSFSGGYYALKSDQTQFSSQAIDQKTYRLNPAMRHEFSRNSSLEASYEYAAVENGADGKTARRELISFRLYLQYPVWE
jgi:hypothetical protein